MAAATLKTVGEDSVLPRAAMIAGEVVLPGASEFVVGNVGSGITTFAVTTLAVAVLAPTMPLLALAAAVGMRANSYKKATTGEGLFSGLPHVELVDERRAEPKSRQRAEAAA